MLTEEERLRIYEEEKERREAQRRLEEEERRLEAEKKERALAKKRRNRLIGVIAVCGLLAWCGQAATNDYERQEAARKADPAYQAALKAEQARAAQYGTAEAAKEHGYDAIAFAVRAQGGEISWNDVTAYHNGQGRYVLKGKAMIPNDYGDARYFYVDLPVTYSAKSKSYAIGKPDVQLDTLSTLKGR